MTTWYEVTLFVERCQAVLDAYQAKHFPNSARETLTMTEGTRYFRVIRISGSSSSSWCFVDKDNGDVLKCAGWKRPAKHPRGNLYDEHKGMSMIGPYGPASLK
jgi:hypothetical protein